MGNDGTGRVLSVPYKNGDCGNRLLAQAPWSGSGLFYGNP